MSKSHQGPFIDELAARRRHSAGPDEEPQEQEPIRGEWRDVLAMVIISYQVIMPYLLVMIGAMLLFGVFFLWYFKG